jgi:hypothetical protein
LFGAERGGSYLFMEVFKYCTGRTEENITNLFGF